MDIGETFRMAFSSLRANKLRAILTILGVAVGIFSITLIMTIITALQSSIESGVSALSKNTFQIQKSPAINMGGPGSRAKYRNRPDITLGDYERLDELLTSAKYIGAEEWQFGEQVQYEGDETNPDVQVAGITSEAQNTNDWIVEEGRPINEGDVDRANPVSILGADVKDALFPPHINPIGLTVKVSGRPLQVIGYYERQGDMFGQSRDNFVAIPIGQYHRMFGGHRRSVNITVQSFGEEDYDEVIDEARGHMRTIRKVEPWDEDDFEIFSNESMLEEMNEITGGVEIGAMVVGFIALLAAGVGIMNIMLVSVTERTREIGVRKAIGAKKRNILTQFLSEAVALCLLGGAIGIALGVGLGNFAGSLLNAQAAAPLGWIVGGLLICVAVGVFFGAYPAYKAANLDPIEALRYE